MFLHIKNKELTEDLASSNIRCYDIKYVEPKENRPAYSTIYGRHIETGRILRLKVANPHIETGPEDFNHLEAAITAADIFDTVDTYGSHTFLASRVILTLPNQDNIVVVSHG